MDSFTRADLLALLEPRVAPCVSIFTATRPGGGADDRGRWGEQLHQAARQLADLGTATDLIDAFLRPAREYLAAGQAAFWQQTGSGLAAFLCPGWAKLYRLPLSLTDRVVVGPRFHVKPLLPCVGDNGRFFVLALSANKARLLEGTAQTVRRVEVPGLPQGVAGARPAHDADEPLNLHTHHAGEGRGMEAVFHGQGVGVDDRKDELLHYCQAVDRALAPILNGGATPLVLAAVEYVAAIYRRANRYPHLAEAVVAGSPDRRSDRDLRDRAWPLVAPQFRTAGERAVAQYRQLAGTGRTVAGAVDVVRAARRGELDTVLVAAGAEAWGRYDLATDAVDEYPAYRPGATDLADLAAAYALGRGRHVHVVESPAALGGAAVAGVGFVPMNKHGK
jgi:hypothetical protein